MSAAKKLETFERRQNPRYEAYKNGIVCVRNRTHINCIIENVSDSGALLHLAAAMAMPKAITLIVPDDRITLECRVVWRDGRHTGVEFTSPPSPFVPPPALAAETRQN